MAELYLVRHGQASFGAGNYDRLSPLGERQSRWLGAYFAERALTFDRAMVGTLQRQCATVTALASGLGRELTAEEHTGLNEYDFTTLVRSYRETTDTAQPPADDHAAFYRLLKRALLSWAAGKLDDHLPESWEDFKQRIADVVADIQRPAAKGERVLVVSSGGPIAAILGAVLALTDEQAIELNMQLYNTSLSRLYFNDRRMVLAGFNAVPHLDTPGRFDAITYG